MNFRSPMWTPPSDYPGRAFQSLPSERDWLLLVAATATADRAEEAARKWLATPAHSRTRTERRLLPLVSANLQSQACGVAIPEEVSAMGNVWLDNETLFVSLSGVVLKDFSEAGIPAALLKGAAAVLLDYRNTALRPRSDFDVLVPFALRHDAIALLLKLGFEPFPPQPEPRFAHRSHGAAYVLRSERLNVDLHWHASWASCWDDADARLWASAEKHAVHGAPYFAPNPALRLIIACVHGFRLSGLPEHSWIGDAAMILTSNRVDWKLLVDESRERRVTRFMFEALTYLVCAMGGPIPTGVLDELKPRRLALLQNELFFANQREMAPRSFLSSSLLSLAAVYRVGANGFQRRDLQDFAEYYRWFHNIGDDQSVLLALARKGMKNAAYEIGAWMDKLSGSFHNTA